MVTMATAPIEVLHYYDYYHYDYYYDDDYYDYYDDDDDDDVPMCLSLSLYVFACMCVSLSAIACLSLLYVVVVLLLLLFLLFHNNVVNGCFDPYVWYAYGYHTHILCNITDSSLLILSYLYYNRQQSVSMTTTARTLS